MQSYLLKQNTRWIFDDNNWDWVKFYRRLKMNTTTVHHLIFFVWSQFFNLLIYTLKCYAKLTAVYSACLWMPLATVSVVHLLTFNCPRLKYPLVTEEEFRLYIKALGSTVTLLLSQMICACGYKYVDFFYFTVKYWFYSTVCISISLYKPVERKGSPSYCIILFIKWTD